MSPLAYFMKELLGNYSGEIQLVSDNAMMMKVGKNKEKIESITALSQVLSTTGKTGNHSCTRWETDVPIPIRSVDHLAQRPEWSPSLSRRPPLLPNNFNSPACPIRKLSPKVPLTQQSRNYRFLLTSPPNVQFSKISPSDKLEGTQGIDHPVKILSIPKAIISHMKPTPRSLLFQMNGSSQTSSLTTEKRTCGIVPSMHCCAPFEEEEEKITGHYEGGKPPRCSFASPVMRPIRGLSQTLLGIDGPLEKAPICPTRRPSKQCHNDPFSDKKPANLPVLASLDQPENNSG